MRRSTDQKASSSGAKSLCTAMQRATYVEGRAGPDLYSGQLATAMLAHFARHGFRGHLPTLGHDPKSPLLTKLRGGLKAWQGGV